jgi:hypothetical protein
MTASIHILFIIHRSYDSLLYNLSYNVIKQPIKKTPWFLVRKQTIPIERSPPVSEASANFSGWRVLRGQRHESLRLQLQLSRPGAATFSFK